MQGGHDHDHDDHDHDHDDHDGHLHDGHEEDIEYDEHIWTSPVNAMALCRAICDTLCEADPDNADGYRARLADYLDELQALDETFRDITDHAARRLLVFGDRFPLLYFCREYDLDYRAAFHGCAGDTEPSLATLKYLIDVVEEQEIPVVYTIELSSREGGAGHRRDHRGAGADIPLLPDGEPGGIRRRSHLYQSDDRQRGGTEGGLS